MTDELPLPVVVVYWSAPDWLTRCVDSLLQSDIPVEVTVVANSPDVPELPQTVRVIDAGSNRGYTGGANIGLSEWIGHKWCLVASHDLLVQPGTLRSMLQIGTSRPEVGVVGPAFEGWRPSHSRWEEEEDLAWVDWTSGACMMIRRQCYEAIGGLDERLGSYAEDIEYCVRAQAAGWRTAVATHATASTIGSKADLEWRLAMSHSNGVYIAAKTSGYRSASRLLQGLVGSWMRHALLGVLPRSNRSAHRTYRRAEGRALRRSVGLLWQLRAAGPGSGLTGPSDTKSQDDM